MVFLRRQDSNTRVDGRSTGNTDKEEINMDKMRLSLIMKRAENRRLRAIARSERAAKKSVETSHKVNQRPDAIPTPKPNARQVAQGQNPVNRKGGCGCGGKANAFRQAVASKKPS